nr:vacuolar protein-sorting-associated protein 36 [Quercus suber]
MFLRQLDLTTALRPSLYDDELLLFVQDGVGLYEGKFKIANYQNGHTYLTSHRVCYVDNSDPRQYSMAIELKNIDRTEHYAGFLKSSAKITLFPRPLKTSQPVWNPVTKYASPSDALIQPSSSGSRSMGQSPALAGNNNNATWICPICGFSNPVPSNFDPSTANQHTPLPPCQACGIAPPLAHLIKASIAGLSHRPGGASAQTQQHTQASVHGSISTSIRPEFSLCPRCTFQNHPSLMSCEMCSAPLLHNIAAVPSSAKTADSRAESPGPTNSVIGNQAIETIKLSFRAGGDKIFLEKLRSALVQRKWLLQSAPPIPKPGQSPVHSANNSSPQPADTPSRSSVPQQRVIGIAGLEQRGLALRQTNEGVIGSAFGDLEALMTSAKEVIAMAEQFAKQTNSSDSSTEAQALLTDSASALGLVTTKDMLGSGSSSETLYITELARNLAEFLTDDRRGILRREGGIMSLVDLWAVFNRTRNGIELISPLDFEKAASRWDTLQLPIRLRRFKSGLLVVQERSRTDEKTVAALLAWLRQPQLRSALRPNDSIAQAFGQGVTAQETAECFHWSVGVATEELEMAEEMGALCRDQCLEGTRFWENHFMHVTNHIIATPLSSEQQTQLTVKSTADMEIR